MRSDRSRALLHPDIEKFSVRLLRAFISVVGLNTAAIQKRTCEQLAEEVPLSQADTGRLRQLVVSRNLVRPLVTLLQVVHLRETQDLAVLKLSDNDPWIDAVTSSKLHYFVLVVGEPSNKSR